MVEDKGEVVICSKCDGAGEYKKPFYIDGVCIEYGETIYKCEKCNRTGKTDWVTNVMGSTKTPNIKEQTLVL